MSMASTHTSTHSQSQQLRQSCPTAPALETGHTRSLMILVMLSLCVYELSVKEHGTRTFRTLRLFLNFRRQTTCSLCLHCLRGRRFLFLSLSDAILKHSGCRKTADVGRIRARDGALVTVAPTCTFAATCEQSLNRWIHC